MAGSSAQMWAVYVSIDGISLGTFDSHSGGEITADVTKHRPGGLSSQITFPALQTVGDLTVTRYWDGARDADILRRLRTRVGLAPATVSVQAIGIDGSPLAGSGTRRTYTGTFSGLKEPESDSNSGDVATYEVTIAVEAVS